MSTRTGSVSSRADVAAAVGRALLQVLAMTLICLVALAGGYCGFRFGSVSHTLAYLRGERVVVDAAERVLGDVRVGEERSVTYIVTNLTAPPIKILGMRVTCTCTSIEAMPGLLPVAVPQTITLKFRPTRNQVSEQYVSSPRIFTDEPSTPQLRLAFAARVIDDPSARHAGPH